MKNCKLYVVSPPSFQKLSLVEENLEAILNFPEVECFQLRLKHISDKELCYAIEAILPACQKHNVTMILNDRVDLVAEYGCDGVHLGPKDMNYSKARNILGKNFVIGVSCQGSRHRAMEVSVAGADYVAFGSFYRSDTKTDSKLIQNSEIIKIWSETTKIPCVAIGGINHDNCRNLIKAGADFLALSSSIWDNPSGPINSVAKFSSILSDNK